MLRVTPDVNMLVEATISRSGPAAVILAAWELGQVELLLCEEILKEYEDVLGRPRIQGRYSHLTVQTIAAAVATLQHYGRLTPLTDIPAVVVADPDDDVVLACAVAGDANYIVSRDHHLLDLAVYRDIPIVPPEGFTAILRGQPPPSVPSPNA